MRFLVTITAALQLVIMTPLLAAPGAAALPGDLPAVVKLRKKLYEHYKFGRLSQAYRVQEKIYKTVKRDRGNKDPRTLRELETTAQLASSFGSSDEALKYIEATVALSLEIHGARSRSHVSALQKLAIRYSVMRQHEKGAKLEKKVLGLTRELEGADSTGYASQLQVAASFAQGRYAFTTARRYLDEAMGIWEKKHGKGARQMSSPLVQMGSLLWQLGDRAGAATTWKRLLAIQETAYGKESPTVASTLAMLAGYYRRAKEEKKALRYDKRARAMYEEAIAAHDPKAPGSPHRLISNRDMLARIHLGQGKLSEARKLLELNLKAREALHQANPAATMNEKLQLVEIYRQEGLYRKALKLLSQVAAMQRKLWGKTLSSNSHYTRARIMTEMGNHKGARASFRTLLKVQEETYGPTHPFISHSLEGLTLAAMGLGDGKAALPTLRRSLELSEREIRLNLAVGNEEENRAFIRSKAYQVDLALSLHQIFLKDDPAAAALAFEILLKRKARALDAAVDTRSLLKSKLSPEARERYAKLTTLRGRLSRLVVAGPKVVPAGTFPARIGALEKEIRELEVELRNLSRAFRAHETKVTLEGVREKLGKDEALIELMAVRLFNPKRLSERGERRYVAYVLTREAKLPFSVDLGEAKALDAQVAAFRKALSSSESLDVEEVALRCHDLLMKPLEVALEGKTKLFISPDGALNLLPFGALMDPAGRYLIRSRTITYLTSGRDLLRQASPSKSQSKTTIFANPVFGTSGAKTTSGLRGRRSVDFQSMSWESLPATDQEADALASVIPGAVIYRGREATEERLKSIKGPSVLHIATHGFFLSPEREEETVGRKAVSQPSSGSENPLLRSGLILAAPQGGGRDDGILTALEAAGLDLEGTSLVVLSACDTAVGDITLGEGVHGLRRALVVAGARSLLMSLWKVDDEATKHLMASYYRKLARGEPPSSALRQVQLSMSRHPRFSHPSYWAAFIPVGRSGKIADLQ